MTAAESAADVPDGEPDPAERDRLVTECRQLRSAETDARLAVRTVEERVRALVGRAESLDRTAASERAARERAVIRLARRERERAVAAAVVDATQQVLGCLESSLQEAARQRAAVDLRRSDLETALAGVRTLVRELDEELDRLTDSVHRDEVARAEQRLRIEQLETRSIEEHGVDPETLLSDYGTSAVISMPADDGEPITIAVRPRGARETTARRRARARPPRTGNPLALEEYAALEERLRFLSDQLEDLKATRRDLLTVVREVANGSRRRSPPPSTTPHASSQTFSAGFSPAARSGSSSLNPTTCSLVASRWRRGRRARRSSGYRCCPAVNARWPRSHLVAIFKARPSPFYVLDEVEAALDDTNLQRLLGMLTELRETSQLIVITHQKRTMEIADALYGVSMRGDGVTSVISQRLREAVSA